MRQSQRTSPGKRLRAEATAGEEARGGEEAEAGGLVEAECVEGDSRLLECGVDAASWAVGLATLCLPTGELGVRQVITA